MYYKVLIQKRQIEDRYEYKYGDNEFCTGFPYETISNEDKTECVCIAENLIESENIIRIDEVTYNEFVSINS